MAHITLDDIKSLPVTCSAVVLPEWLDEMGHMNVMWYTYLFSEGTYGFTSLFGMTKKYMQEYKAGAFAKECHIRYFKELHTGQKVHTRTCAVDRTDKQFHVMHFVVNEEDGCIAAIGEYFGAYVDLVKRNLSIIPDNIGNQYDTLMAEHKALGLELSLSKRLAPEVIV